MRIYVYNLPRLKCSYALCISKFHAAAYFPDVKEFQTAERTQCGKIRSTLVRASNYRNSNVSRALHKFACNGPKVCSRIAVNANRVECFSPGYRLVCWWSGENTGFNSGMTFRGFDVQELKRERENVRESTWHLRVSNLRRSSGP